MVDGVFVADSAGVDPVFHPLPPPCDDELADIVRRLAVRIRKIVPELGGDTPDEDELAEQHPLLAACASASITGRDAFDPQMRV